MYVQNAYVLEDANYKKSVNDEKKDDEKRKPKDCRHRYEVRKREKNGRLGGIETKANFLNAEDDVHSGRL